MRRCPEENLKYTLDADKIVALAGTVRAIGKAAYMLSTPAITKSQSRLMANSPCAEVNRLQAESAERLSVNGRYS
jgi:hypothetical protein